MAKKGEQKRIHARSVGHFDGVFTTKPEYKDEGVDSKPYGVWWGVGAAWMEWGASVGFDSDADIYELTLDEARLLRIQDLVEFDGFHDEFSVIDLGLTGRSPLHLIDWPRVASAYDGIEIAPFHQIRHCFGPSRDWYNGWECACGVTWKPSAVIQECTYIGKWTEGGTPIRAMLEGAGHASG